MSGLAIPKAAAKKPVQSSNSVAGPSKSGSANGGKPGSGPGSNNGDEDKEMEDELRNRPMKAVVGVPEITNVEGLVPTLQWVSASFTMILAFKGDIFGLHGGG